MSESLHSCGQEEFPWYDLLDLEYSVNSNDTTQKLGCIAEYFEMNVGSLSVDKTKE